MDGGPDPQPQCLQGGGPGAGHEPFAHNNPLPSGDHARHVAGRFLGRGGVEGEAADAGTRRAEDIVDCLINREDANTAKKLHYYDFSENKMKNIIYIFLSILAITSVGFGQEMEIKGLADSTSVDTVSQGQTLTAKDSILSVLMDSVYQRNNKEGYVFFGLNASYSYINQANTYFAINQGGFGKHFGLETSILNLSTIKYNGFRYYSSNSLPTLVIFIPMGIGQLITGKDITWYILPFWMVIGIPTIVEAATNFKIGYKLNENIKLLAGLRTDFYYFYPDTRTSRQLLTGARFTFKRFNIDAFYNYPWARGFINNEKSFLSVGVSYDALKEANVKSGKKSKKSKGISRLLH